MHAYWLNLVSFSLPLQGDDVLRVTRKQLHEYKGYLVISNRLLNAHVGPEKSAAFQGNPKAHGLAKQTAAQKLRDDKVLYTAGKSTTTFGYYSFARQAGR